MNCKLLLSTALLTFASIQANAVPAYPKQLTLQQPDGTEITATLHGDEHHNYAVTPDGYTLLHDAQGFWAFATKAENGDLTASPYRYKGSSEIATANGIAKGLKFSQNQLKAIAEPNKSLQVPATFPSIGQRKLLVILVNFGDTETIYTQEQFNNYMNQEGYLGIGSFRDFYYSQSGGLLDIQTTVTPWLKLTMSKSFYNPDIVDNLIIEALQLADETIDFNDYDNDKDGILDGLAIIHQGFGRETSGASSDIWSHSSTIYGVEFDGVKIGNYTIQPEQVRTGEMSGIGVMCHEFGHNLGSPDFYDTDYEQSGGDFSGTGNWDTMASGAWNGNFGDKPAGFNAWQKCMFGWIRPAMLENSCKVTGMKDITENADLYQINTTIPGEYFLLENRQHFNIFDSETPGTGLLIYHVNENLIEKRVSNNMLNASFPQSMYVVSANAFSDPEEGRPASYGNPNMASATFPGANDEFTFNDNTAPSSKTASGRRSYFSIEDITEDENGIISFDFVKLATPATPRDLKATASEGTVTLTWTAPDSPEKPVAYNIYYNDILLGTTSKTEFFDGEPQQGVTITYSVDATYADGNTSPYVSATVRVSSNMAENVTVAENPTGGAQVRWSLTGTLTRMTAARPETAKTTTYTGTEIGYYHNFRSQDLLTYKGAQIKSVSFYPMNTPVEAEYSVRIWETNAKGVQKLLCEQPVSEFGTYTLTTVALKTPVIIVAGREYTIGINCKSTRGIDMGFLVRTDEGPVTGHMQNLEHKGGNWYSDEFLTGNYALYATVQSATPTNPSVMPADTEITDPDLDYLYPIGFAVYRNGIKIGTTGNCVFNDPDAADGDRYTVSSIYRGDNESVQSEEIVFGDGAVEAVKSNTAVYADAGCITIGNYTGTVEIFNLSGAVVYKGTVENGKTIAVAKGAYIVKTTGKAEMVLVR